MRNTTMHRLAIGVGTLLLGAALAAAQTAGGQEANGDRQGNRRGGDGKFQKHGARLARELGLSDEQKQQMKTLHESQGQQMQALRNDTSLTREQKRAQMMQIAKDSRQKIEAILTPEQREKMKQLRAEHKRERKGGRREGFRRQQN